MAQKVKCTFKRPKNSFKWKFSRDQVKRFNELCDTNIGIKELHRVLESTKEYYLNEYGLTSNGGKTIVVEQVAAYMWMQLKDFVTKTKEPVNVWMYSDGVGGFKNIKFGSRYDFDNVVLKGLPTQILNALNSPRPK